MRLFPAQTYASPFDIFIIYNIEYNKKYHLWNPKNGTMLTFWLVKPMKKTDPYKEWKKINKEIKRNDELILHLLEETEEEYDDEIENDDEYDEYCSPIEDNYKNTTVYTDIEEPTRIKSKWYHFAGILFCLSIIVNCYKYIFPSVIDMRWVLASAVFFILFIILKIINI